MAANRFLTAFVMLCLSLLLRSVAVAEDWPMWRGNAQRTAVSMGALPPELKLLWQKNLQPRTQVWDDPLNLDLMTYDRVFEPIVVGKRLFLSFNDRDKVSAFDTDTGQELWSTFADAPVRLPPVGTPKGIFFTSDATYKAFHLLLTNHLIS